MWRPARALGVLWVPGGNDYENHDDDDDDNGNGDDDDDDECNVLHSAFHDIKKTNSYLSISAWPWGISITGWNEKGM